MSIIKNENGQVFEFTEDIPYRVPDFYQNAPANADRCKLDLTIPVDHKGFSTVIWFHGGGLTSGCKFTPMALTADPEHPSAVVACGYRLAGTDGAKCIACLDDAACAVAWVLKNIENYGGNPAKVFICGHSAGAYLAAMIGMDPQYLRRYGCDYTQLSGLMPISGQCITHFTIREENNIPITQATCNEFAPLYHTNTPNLPPILLTTGQGDLEMCGRTEENAYFCRMLKLSGQKDVTHLIFDGYGHGCDYPSYPMCVQFIRRIAWS